jgi:hypothetical protein
LRRLVGRGRGGIFVLSSALRMQAGGGYNDQCDNEKLAGETRHGYSSAQAAILIPQ